MKKLVFLLCLVLAAGVGFAQEAQEDEAKKAPEQAAEAKTHDVKAVAVSADVEAKTITIKGEEKDKVLPVGEKALTALKEIKGGEKVVLTCEDDEKGEHKKIVAITVETEEEKEEKKEKE